MPEKKKKMSIIHSLRPALEHSTSRASLSENTSKIGTHLFAAFKSPVDKKKKKKFFNVLCLKSIFFFTFKTIIDKKCLL